MSHIGIFVSFPWLALVPALVFGVGAYRTRSVVVWVAAATWLLYAGYETAMARRILCSGECNIRIDLLMIYPALLALSALAAFAWFLGRRSRAGSGPVAQ